MNRCKLCLEEIPTTRDGIEIDHLPDCSRNPLAKQVEIVWDKNTQTFYIRRHDNPDAPLTPIHSWCRARSPPEFAAICGRLEE